MSGVLTHIVIGENAGEALEMVDQVEAVAGQGLKGDRYFFGKGSFNRPPLDQSKREVTLMETQAVTMCNLRLGSAFEAVDFRRNLLLDGIDLKTLKGKTFRIGAAVFRYAGTAPPCRYLARLLGADMMNGLKGIGGIRATIVTGGSIRVGEQLEVVDEIS